jgi:hypothetical protein
MSYSVSEEIMEPNHRAWITLGIFAIILLAATIFVAIKAEEHPGTTSSGVYHGLTAIFAGVMSFLIVLGFFVFNPDTRLILQKKPF